MEARNKAVFKEAKQDVEAEMILYALEKAQIKCLPLKGLIIKHLYPQPDMRLMADVDILVETSQLEKARDIMLSLGYTAVHAGGNHDVYYKKPVMNIELHRALIAESYYDLNAYFGSGWERARLIAGSNCRYEMSNEDYYIYLIGHFAKHCQVGGAGIRSVMDVWVYKRHYQDQLDWNYINLELEKVSLHIFAKNLEALSEQWFIGEVCSENENYQEMKEFVLTNGTYGTSQNAEIKKFYKGKNDRESFNVAKIKHVLRILVPDRKHMIILFPYLQKLPFLLSLCWVFRGIRAILFRRSNIKRNLGNIAYLKEEEVKHMMNIQQKLFGMGVH